MQTTTHQVTLDVAVVNEKRVIDAAARQMVRTKARNTYSEAIAFIGSDVQVALRLILDPGVSGDGFEINESGCEEV